jgi:glycosyltransferase involved in cell wall biosynthesis
MARLKIVHIITGLRRAGAETMLAKLLETMDATRFQQSVIVLQDRGKLAERIERAGVPVVALNMESALHFPVALARTSLILRTLAPQVVQTWLYHADFVGTLAAKLAGNAKLIWNIRCSDMDFSDYNPATRLVCRMLVRLSSIPDLVISNSMIGQEAHAKIGYHPRGWRLLPNGFDTNRFRPDVARGAQFRASIGVEATTPLIGLPARFDPMKDHDSFLRAAAVLAKDRPDVKYVMIGRGLTPDNAEIRARIVASGLQDRVHLVGERNDMEAVMAGLDMVTLCSAYGEGFPNVLGEALSCGVLCVATDVGDAAIIVGRYGRIVPPRNADALASAWRDLLALSPASRADLGTRARQHVIARYSLPVIARAYEDLYDSIA